VKFLQHTNPLAKTAVKSNTIGHYLMPRRESTANTTFFNPSDYASIYDFPPMPTRPITIGVISLGGGLYGSYNSRTGALTNGDVHASWAACGIPANAYPKVLIAPVGSNNRPHAAGTEENTLDVTVIGACYPRSNVTIILFIAPNSFNGFRNAFSAAINGTRISGTLYKPSVISCSWGASEKNWVIYGRRGIVQTAASVCRSIDSLFATAVAKGIVICCASGDDGSSNGEPGRNVDFPASSPNVIACGGTSLVCPNKIWDSATVETTWNNVQGATGGGVSAIFTRPAYQSGTGRYVPDIAMNADPMTGVAIILNKKVIVFGGTSAVAPAMAAFVARCPKPCTVAALYKVPATCFNDITVGNNGYYQAGAGYDKCTGRGSLKGTVLASKL
jgi:kumamolisin